MKKILLATMLIIFAAGLWRNHVVISRSGGSSPQVTPQPQIYRDGLSIRVLCVGIL